MSSAEIPSLQEVNTALKEAGVYSDVLPASSEHQLKGVLEIVYPSGVSVTVRATPHRDQVTGEPTIRFHPISALDTNATYTLIMTDPDLMKRNDPMNKQVRHWVLPGLTPSSTGQLFRTRKPHTNFLASAPLPGTGAHRYVFILAHELDNGEDCLGVGERGGAADLKDRLQFVAADFIKENGLEVVGVAFMQVAPTAAAAVDNVKLMAEAAAHAVTG